MARLTWKGEEHDACMIFDCEWIGKHRAAFLGIASIRHGILGLGEALHLGEAFLLPENCILEYPDQIGPSPQNAQSI